MIAFFSSLLLKPHVVERTLPHQVLPLAHNCEYPFYLAKRGISLKVTYLTFIGRVTILLKALPPPFSPTIVPPNWSILPKSSCPENKRS